MITALLASWLFTATLKGSLLVALALAVVHLAKNRMPSRWLCALLLVGVVRLLMPVAPAAPFSAFNLLRDATLSAPMPILIETAPAVRPRMTRVAAAPRFEAAATPSWQLTLLALWFAGVLLFAGRVLVRTCTFRRSLRHARVLDDPEVLRLIDEGRDALRVHRGVRVLESSAVSTPSLHGWLQPALLLPEGFLTTFCAGQLRYVVLHELAHVRRADVLVNWLVTAARALHWFNPLVHFAAAKLAEERELACDALALAALRDHARAAYGGTVLELVDRLRLRTTTLVPAVVGMSTTKRQLHRRIQMIATFRKSRHTFVFALALLGIGLVTLTDATAGERRMFRRMQAEPLSPATQVTVDRLEQKFSAEFDSASIDDVAHAVSNATGVAIQYEEGALTDDVRKARVSIKAKDVPAHLVLAETFAAVDLAIRFNDDGVLVEKIPGGEKVFTRVAPAPEEADIQRDRVIVVSSPEDLPVRERTFVVREGNAPADGQRNVIRFRGADDQEGTFELELKREQ
ncbi:MAG TPA: M56 family metallopeptidase [Thermoanaerobaculia bacterium]|nr:M56 family metallopeptidase [Thermoanaerobaculia bacterium]